METDLDTLATAFHAAADDLLKAHPERVPARPRIGISPKITDAQLLTLALMQAFLGFTSEARRLRHARRNLAGMFPYLPGQAGYNKRLRRLGPTMKWLIGVLVQHSDIGCDDVWVVDSTRLNAPGPGKRSAARKWRAGPNTATAPLIHATSGACGCTWSAPCTGCRSGTP